MSRPKPIGMSAVLLTVAAAAVAGAAVYSGLSLASRPPDLKARLARIDRQTHEIERLQARAQGPNPYAPGAVCSGAAEPAMAALQQRLRTAAATAGVTLSNLAAAPQTPDEARGGLQPVTLQFQASGPYAPVVGLLQTLSASSPEVFVDTVDLKSDVSSVTLKFSGRLFCSPPAAL